MNRCPCSHGPNLLQDQSRSRLLGRSPWLPVQFKLACPRCTSELCRTWVLTSIKRRTFSYHKRNAVAHSTFGVVCLILSHCPPSLPLLASHKSLRRIPSSTIPSSVAASQPCLGRGPSSPASSSQSNRTPDFLLRLHSQQQAFSVDLPPYLLRAFLWKVPFWPCPWSEDWWTPGQR